MEQNIALALAHIKNTLELYRLTPDEPHFNIRTNEMSTRGAQIPLLEKRLQQLEAGIWPAAGD